MTVELPPIPILLREARGAFAVGIRREIARRSLPTLPIDGPFVLGALRIGDAPLEVLVRERERSIERHQTVARLVDDGYLVEVDGKLQLSERGAEGAEAVAGAISELTGHLRRVLGDQGFESFVKGLVTLIEFKEHVEEDH